MSVEKEIMYKLLNNSPTDKLVCLGTLNLAENPAFPESHEGIGLTIHRIDDQDDLDIQQIGLIVAQRCPIKNILPFFSNSNNLFKVAYAQSSSFNWYGHQNNRNFKEKYVDNKTVHRIYNDGWILEYKLDATGRSIPSSFIWVEKG
jgi:hypothetical protein